MKISKSISQGVLKFIVRSGKNVVFRGESLEDAQDFVKKNKTKFKKEEEKAKEEVAEEVKEEKPKRKSFFKKE